MTNEEAKKMLKAKLECLKNETSGINYGCNMRLCEGCSLNYEQGNIGEQEEALDMAIKALEQTQLDKAYNKILKHFEEVKRLTIDEFNNCNRLGNEGFRKRGFIEATMYFEEYVKNLKEGAE